MKLLKHSLFLLLLILISCGGGKQLVKFNSDNIKFSKDAVKFAVIGDWGRDGKFNQKEVGEAMGKVNQHVKSDFIVSVGDNIYPSGVASINDTKWKTSFEEVYTHIGTQIPWYVVLGNHDYKGNPQAQIDYSNRSNRWKMPARYYSFEKVIGKKGTVLFAFIDSNIFEDKYFGEKSNFSDLKQQNKQAQIDWLIKTLDTSKAKWKIVVGHHPFYSSGLRKDIPNSVRQQLEPIFNEYNIDVYLAGHEHHLEYSKNNNIHYFISGAGSQLRETEESSNHFFSTSTNGFLLFSVEKNSIKVYFIDYKGDLLNITSISK